MLLAPDNTNCPIKQTESHVHVCVVPAYKIHQSDIMAMVACVRMGLCVWIGILLVSYAKYICNVWLLCMWNRPLMNPPARAFMYAEWNNMWRTFRIGKNSDSNVIYMLFTSYLLWMTQEFTQYIHTYPRLKERECYQIIASSRFFSPESTHSCHIVYYYVHFYGWNSKSSWKNVSDGFS